MPYDSDAARLVGRRLKELRTEAGATRLWLGVHAGVDVSNITKYETGKALPSLGTLVRLAEALEAEPGELIVGLRSRHLPQGKPDPLPVREYVEARRKSARR